MSGDANQVLRRSGSLKHNTAVRALPGTDSVDHGWGKH
ncbi:hypothetical protein RISK_004016 [Rhodopirellula islandica]|uniref:Uncharacterized protein n=1 Tax=Rhodopirellula islandica TaxID=595434 RepID=A0A0J1BBN0_RHOIS|nr:hypothetical protein RISK_004016 [Rhodopirellula islandica]